MERKYKFIDLFAGIGGFHLGLSRNGMECVFASELDKSARKTYLANHKIDEALFNDDIRKISPNDIPEHDILCAGFPCQPFSQAGHKKGFDDGTNSERGNLFFCILDVLEAKRPKAFILENVRHLLKHDNGNTFEIIKNSLEEIGYNVSYKVIKATDFGKPQHRPRIYIIGFDTQQIDIQTPYEFPSPIPLKMTMSDIWEGDCDREIGFTLRVGGRGSSIDDRRNWDSYRVNGEVKQLTPLQGKRMMGYDDDFILPKTMTAAMKQLGNSVCVDVIEHLAKSVKEYINHNEKKDDDINMTNYSFNKGEWSEIYVFLKLLMDNNLHFGTTTEGIDDSYVIVLAVNHNLSDKQYHINNSHLNIVDINGNLLKSYPLSDVLSRQNLTNLLNTIKTTSGSSFEINNLEQILANLDVNKFKGNSYCKGDINVTFQHDGLTIQRDPLGIKSNLGAKPTLLNASSATNFIYKIEGFDESENIVNSIETTRKIKDRLLYLKSKGYDLTYQKCEKEVHENNLRLIDTNMPKIISNILLKYYLGHGSSIRDLVETQQEAIRIQDYLKAVMLGMFSSTQWDGYTTSNGSILVHSNGELTLYHVIKERILKEYLFNNTKLDTPSSTRHRFGTVYKEGNAYYIKLNLQIRMS